jgi:uncharacterized DUF497 family protein
MVDFDVVKWVRVFRKHGLPMQLARLVFEDGNVAVFRDSKHSKDEDRFLAYGLCLGYSMIVSFVMRGDDARVITIRRVHKKEWEQYYDKE